VKFLVDAQLPMRLVQVLEAAGHDAVTPPISRTATAPRIDKSPRPPTPRTGW
jgi:predicted nuclease of predicted toxin-antitoxin system